ncbi:MAG: glutamate--tRNA ligase [Candidatus Electryonea clarkiae]|nr:glutamate--tRNA ligase [Candidatus Electryonea clarkiae]MDP8287395.1 glutamate--tRNA ligase [Candidatus Electryonea clarkiae]
MSIPRLRFAPSPTGYLHIGGARTAIFNWLLARKLGGKFLLRIEDTDKSRSKKEYEDDILDAMQWLNIVPDEELLRQSNQGSFYREVVDALIQRGAAYRDFVSPEETEMLKAESIKSGVQVAFRGIHRDMNQETSDRLVETGEPYAVRFKIPDESVVFQDGVHGKVEVPPDSIEDFVIMRRDFTPTYQVAVVSDDFLMGITHVIRGDDHISNTPKQTLIYKAMGWEPPEFIHVPLILGPDKKRLSKRHGASAVTEYRDKGYQPEAIFNFLALLGWSPGDDRENMTPEEMIEAFSIKGINPKSAVFDEKKLEWMNGEYLSRLPDEVLIKQLRPVIAEKVISGELPKGCGSMLPVAVKLIKSRARVPLDIIDRNLYFFKEPETLDPKAAKKRLKDPETPERLEELARRFDALSDFNEETTDEVLRTYAEELEVGSGKLIHPTRLAVTGIGGGPGLYDVLIALGKEKVINRMKWLADLLREKGTPPNLS